MEEGIHKFYFSECLEMEVGWRKEYMHLQSESGLFNSEIQINTLQYLYSCKVSMEYDCTRGVSTTDLTTNVALKMASH